MNNFAELPECLPSLRSAVAAAVIVGKQTRRCRNGLSRSKTRRTTVHQRGCCEGQRRSTGLLPDVGVSSVGSDSRHPWAHRTVRIHLLFPRLVPPLPSSHHQGQSQVEQVFQVSEDALYRRARWRSFYLCPVLDFPLRNGACVLIKLTRMISKF